MEKKTRIALVSLHESGLELPEIEIDAAELAAFNWLPNLWGMDCILEVGKSTKEHVRYAAQTTAWHAEHQTVYTVTGWRKIDGRWVFLLPGNEEYTVSLYNKMHGYGMAEEASAMDLAILTRLLTQIVAYAEIPYDALGDIRREARLRVAQQRGRIDVNALLQEERTKQLLEDTEDWE